MTLLDDIDDGDLSANSSVLGRFMPGYDYRSRETTAETDRTVRRKVDRDLGEVTKTLDDVSDRLYRRDDRDLVEALDRLESDVERLRTRVTSASSGGGTVRNLAVEDEEALVALVEYDASLVAGVEDLLDRADEIRAAVEDGRPVEPLVTDCETAVDDLDRTFTRRQDYMEGLKE